MSESKSYIATLKESASDHSIGQLKESIKSFGGEITNEFSLFKGFSFKLPSIHSESITKHESIATIEEDQEVKTQ